MGEFSLTHVLIVAVIFLIFFGPKKLPELGKSLGEAIKGFKKAINTDEKDTSQNNQQNTVQISQPSDKDKDRFVKDVKDVADEAREKEKTHKG
ncbi:MAG: twin-arginine translocase TatA/TatE family subunit [Bdellovibrio sp.]|nr:MAG: twin-arginine translocase TatA/TatE family subunit [Bdellovibrio sp.]